MNFSLTFYKLTDREPMPWQRRLFEEFCAGQPPEAIDLPTGLGKTSIIPIWLIALAEQARAGKVELPRRLAYVVDRRTVVDQASDVAEKLRSSLQDGKLAEVASGLKTLSGDPDKLLAISTLRGEFADNKEWQEDPARAAIIVGTVDMIGSRLLHSAYGVSRKMRPFHAGLIGQDTLIVHDEAHLSPAFGQLIRAIACLQTRAEEPRPLRVVELSATQRDSTSAPGKIFSLAENEKAEGLVQQRLAARKTLRGRAPEKGKTLEQTLADAASAYDADGVRVIVYVRSPKAAAAVVAILTKEKKIEAGRIATLTGTIRGHERDQMASPRTTLEGIEDETARQRAKLFREFKSQAGRGSPERTQYLIATSAGEVGIDLDAEHMVCDLTTLDSMIQRLGRLNRLGECAANVIVVVNAPAQEGDDDEALSDTEKRIATTRQALEALPEIDGGHDASPQALRNLVDRMKEDRRAACFSKQPRMVELTDILLDGWAMTSIENLPGRPPVERWLHGIAATRPSTFVAWRAELEDVVASENAGASLKTLFDKHPILARERLRGNREDVIEELKKIARRFDRDVVLLPARGNPRTAKLADLVKKENEDDLRDATIVLPPEAGGLDTQGMLDGGAKDRVVDVADVMPPGGVAGTDGPAGAPQRLRVLVRWNEEAETWERKTLGVDGPWDSLNATAFRQALKAVREKQPEMTEKTRVILARDNDGEETKGLMLLARRGSLDAAEESQDAAADQPVLLCDHNRDVAREAESIARRLGLSDELREAVTLAAKWHDVGKNRAGWQKAIGNPRPRGDTSGWKPWAKSNQRGFDDSACGRYRHEFGSLRQALADSEIANHAERDLILQLIAAHHGWARPHFEDEHGDIEEGGYEENPAVAAETLRRFGRLQRRFGRWGLAWLEALLRAADYRVSSGKANRDPATKEGTA